MAMTARVTNAAGRVIATTRNGVRHYHQHDALGNTVALINDSGVVTDTYTYWPYGEIRTSTGTTVNPFKFCGAWGYYTDASGRLYVRARTLRTALGRWLTVDPLWPSESVYGYCRSIPVGLIDSMGLAPIGFPRCTKQWNDYIVDFCRKCHSAPHGNCLRECSDIAREYYNRCGKQPPRPLPSPIGPPDYWYVEPGVGIVPPPLPKPIVGLDPPEREIGPSPPGPMDAEQQSRTQSQINCQCIKKGYDAGFIVFHLQTCLDCCRKFPVCYFESCEDVCVATYQLELRKAL